MGSLESINTETEPRTQIKSAIVEMGPEGSRNFLWDMGWNNLQAGFAGLGGREYVFLLDDDYGDSDDDVIILNI